MNISNDDYPRGKLTKQNCPPRPFRYEKSVNCCDMRDNHEDDVNPNEF